MNPLMQAPMGNPMMSQGAPMGQPNPAMMGAPQGQPMPPQAPAPQQAQMALQHIDRMIPALLSLTGKKPGTLTKKDVFGAAADMIKQGGFPSADEKKGLIGELASLPEDEPALRMALGQRLLMMAQAKQHLGAFDAN